MVKPASRRKSRPAAAEDCAIASSTCSTDDVVVLQRFGLVLGGAHDPRQLRRKRYLRAESAPAAAQPRKTGQSLRRPDGRALLGSAPAFATISGAMPRSCSSKRREHMFGRRLRVVLVQSARIGGVKRVADALRHLLYVHVLDYKTSQGATISSVAETAGSLVAPKERVAANVVRPAVGCSTSRSGAVRAYYLFDVADTIDSGQDQRPRRREPRPCRACRCGLHAPPYLQFPVPPLVANLPEAEFDGLPLFGTA